MKRWICYDIEYPDDGEAEVMARTEDEARRLGAEALNIALDCVCAVEVK